jgi:hypothetical protein
MKKLHLLTSLLLLTGFKLFAQSHLKDVQTTSIWAPAGVKIDGKINEWEDSFQAYNKSTRLFYTISNNEKYLYLAVTSTDAGNNTKIAAGGITLTINTAAKKKDKNAYSLTYPVITRALRGHGRGLRGGGAQSDVTDTAVVNAAHRQFISSAKEIKVLGFKDMDDTLISIYNEYGIKAAIGYDTLGNYSYELAVPLKVLGISPDSIKEIAYNIKVNGLQIAANNAFRGGNGGGDNGGGGFAGNGGGGFGGGGGGRRGGGTTGGGKSAGNGGNNIDFADLTTPTDFWAKYTLATK